MSKSRGRGKTFNLSPFFRIFMPKFSLTFIASKGTNAPMTLPVTLPAAVKTHPIPPNSTQFCVKGICMIKQLFTVICGSASSDSKSRGTWYHGGSTPPFGTNKINHLREFNFLNNAEKGMTLPVTLPMMLI
jgi:hypothetical protein